MLKPQPFGENIAPAKLKPKSAVFIPASISIDIQKCIGCGVCAEVCPFGLPEPNQIGRYEIQRTDLCTECSACARNCPVSAINLKEEKGCGCIWCAPTTDGDSCDDSSTEKCC